MSFKNTLQRLGIEQAMNYLYKDPEKVEENGPGDVAAVFCPQRLLLRPSNEAGIDEEIGRQCFHHSGVNIIHHRWCHRGPGNFSDPELFQTGADAHSGIEVIHRLLDSQALQSIPKAH